MKNKAILLSAILISVLVITGCGTMQKVFYKPTVTQVEPEKTVTVVQPMVSTDPATGVQTTSYTTNRIALPATYATNWVVAPWLTTTVAVGKAAPVPYLNTALALVGALAGAGASYMNMKPQLNTKDKVIGTLVQNVDQIRDAALTIPAYAEIDKKIMDGVKTLQRVSGVKDEIHAAVETHT
jgi:hypothetical protein